MREVFCEHCGERVPSYDAEECLHCRMYLCLKCVEEFAEYKKDGMIDEWFCSEKCKELWEAEQEEEDE